MENSIYYMIISNMPFMAASANDVQSTGNTSQMGDIQYSIDRVSARGKGFKKKAKSIREPQFGLRITF
jgi:hypothetical protein